MLNWLSRPPPSEIKPAETKAARTMVAWHAPGRPVWSARDHAAFAREGYAKNAVAHRCVRLIAEAAASAPLRVTPHEHPLATLLARPNPEQTGVELFEAFFSHLQVAGNAYLEAFALEDGGPPVDRWARPFAPVHVRGRRAASGDVTIRWTRRARLEGDAWLGEPPEEPGAPGWRVDILAPGGAILRSLSGGSPELVYPAAA